MSANPKNSNNLNPNNPNPNLLNLNITVVAGCLSSDARSREVRSASTVVNLEVRIGHPDRPADSVPVVCFDPPDWVIGLVEGDTVVVVGSVRRRFFRAGGSTASRTEIVADRVVKATRRAQVRRVIEAASDGLTDLLT